MKTLKKWLRIITPLVGNLTNVTIIFYFLEQAHGRVAAFSGAIFFEAALMVIAGVAQTDTNKKTITNLLRWHLGLAVVLAVYGGWMFLAEQKPNFSLFERGLTAILAGAPFPVVNYYLTKVIFDAKDLVDTSEIQKELLYQGQIEEKQARIDQLLLEIQQNQVQIDEYSAFVEQKREELAQKDAEIARMEQLRAAKPSADEQRVLTAKQIGASIVSRQLPLKQVVQSVLDKKEDNKRDAAQVLGVDVRTLNRLLED